MVASVAAEDSEGSSVLHPFLLKTQQLYSSLRRAIVGIGDSVEAGDNPSAGEGDQYEYLCG